MDERVQLAQGLCAYLEEETPFKWIVDTPLSGLASVSTQHSQENDPMISIYVREDSGEVTVACVKHNCVFFYNLHDPKSFNPSKLRDAILEATGN
jgi:hypothetical protein